MNTKMQEYIMGIKLYVTNAKTQCHYVALTDDGTVDKEERKNLKRLDHAIERLMKDLDKIK